MRINATPQANMLMLTMRIQPVSSEQSKAMVHKLATRKRLEKSFDVSKFIPTGSHVRKTAIRWHSDVDIMVLLRKNEAKWGGNIVKSSTVLRKIRDDLSDRYTTTDVRTDQQAVVVHFGKGQHSLDVVPAIFNRFDKGGPVYWIPDGEGGWLETSPERHNKYFYDASERGRMLNKLVQLVKWWKFCRINPIPLNSFHVDMLLASSGICVGIKSYTQCLYEAFALLARRECRGFTDPVGISGVLYAANTTAQWEILKSAVNYALAHSRQAIIAENAGDFEEANRQWGIVFNDQY